MGLDDVVAEVAFGGRNRWVLWFRRSVLIRQLVLLAVWLLLWEMGSLVEYRNFSSVWFPAAGLTFAALMVMGPRALPTLAVGCVLITFADAHHYQTGLGRGRCWRPASFLRWHIWYRMGPPGSTCAAKSGGAGGTCRG